MAIWVGLTGGIGSGKTKVASEFTNIGVPVIDADAISRHLTAEHGQALPAIRTIFGDSFFDEQGLLKREKLREKIFKNENDKIKLETLMFPLIISNIKALQQQYSQACYGIIDMPLLVDYPQFLALVDRVLVVDVSEETQIQRVALRNGLSVEEIKRIMATQANRLQRLRSADDVIVNDGSIAQLSEKVQRLHQYYQSSFSIG